MAETQIQVGANGPLIVSGDIELLDAEGNPYDLAGRRRLALCRCGHSTNKPFCDGSHRKAGFRSEEQARSLPPPKR